MFTLEIDGKAIAITDADEMQAREVFSSQEFKSDLSSMESEGRPLWDGVASFRIRAASEEEMDAFDETMGEEEDPDQDDEEDAINILFLVPIDDSNQGTAAN